MRKHRLSPFTSFAGPVRGDVAAGGQSVIPREKLGIAPQKWAFIILRSQNCPALCGQNSSYQFLHKISQHIQGNSCD